MKREPRWRQLVVPRAGLPHVLSLPIKFSSAHMLIISLPFLLFSYTVCIVAGGLDDSKAGWADVGHSQSDRVVSQATIPGILDEREIR